VAIFLSCYSTDRAWAAASINHRSIVGSSSFVLIVSFFVEQKRETVTNIKFLKDLLTNNLAMLVKFTSIGLLSVAALLGKGLLLVEANTDECAGVAFPVHEANPMPTNGLPGHRLGNFVMPGTTKEPTNTPTKEPTIQPTEQPSNKPTNAPTFPVGVEAPVIEVGQCETEPVDVCFAIDLSGSVCGNSREFDTFGCDNFQYEKHFATGVIEKLKAINDDARFSLVTFASDADTQLNLTGVAATASSKITSIVYTDGYTTTGGAIMKCTATLTNTTNARVIVLITDGTPTNGYPGVGRSRTYPPKMAKHKEFATEKAVLAKNAGILLVPIIIATDDTDKPYMKSLASGNNTVVSVTNFDLLPAVVDAVVSVIGCATPSKLDTVEIPDVVTANCGGMDPVRVCFAIDMSGSVCNPESSNSANLCSSCPNQCHQSAFNQSTTCCENFSEELVFSKSIIGKIAAKNDQAQFSVVSFASDASTNTELSPSSTASSKLDGLIYSGGRSDTAGGIGHCTETLGDGVGYSRVMILVTDGKPTNPEGDPKQDALDAANSAKAAGITIIPVLVGTVALDEDYMKSLASSTTDVVMVKHFSQLPNAVDTIVDFVECVQLPGTTRGPTISPSNNPSTSSAPSNIPTYSNAPSNNPTRALLCTLAESEGFETSDFNNGYGKWVPGGSSDCVIAFSPGGSNAVRLMDSSSTSMVTRIFTDEIGDLDYDNTVTVIFDLCGHSIEGLDRYGGEKLYFKYQIGNGDWVTGKLFEGGVDFHGGCSYGQKVDFNIPAHTSSFSIRFQTNVHRYGDSVFIDNVCTEWCGFPPDSATTL